MGKLNRWKVMSLAALAVMGAGHTARAQVMADRVPAAVIAYVGWSGTDAQGAAYAGSHLKGMLDAMQLPAFVMRAVDKEFSKEANAEDAAVLQAWWSAVGKSPSVMFLDHMEWPQVGQPPIPHAAIFSKVGKETAEKVAAQMEALRQRSPTAPGPMG